MLLFFAPIIQVISIAYILIEATDLLQKPRLKISLTEKKIGESIRDAIIFFVVNSILVIVFSLYTSTKKYESNTDDDDEVLNHSSQMFLYICTNIVFQLYITFYSAVGMFFVSLHLKECLEALRQFSRMLRLADKSENSVTSSRQPTVSPRLSTVSPRLSSISPRLTSISSNSVASVEPESKIQTDDQYMDLECKEQEDDKCSQSYRVCTSIYSYTMKQCLKCWDCVNNKDFRALKDAKVLNVSIGGYRKNVEEVAKRIDQMGLAMNLILFSATLSSIAYFFLVWFLVTEHENDAGLKAIVYLPFVLKEVYFFFYVLWKGVRINTLHDNISLFLADNILDFVLGFADDKISQLQINQLYAIQYHASLKPIALNFFSFRISYYNFWFLFGTFLITALGTFVRGIEIVEKNHIL